MAHLLRILTDAKIKRGLVLTGQNLADIDENTKKAVNGDGGGTYSPAAPIEIAGVGIVIAGPWTMSAGVAFTTAPSNPITFGKGDASDYFGLPVGHSGRTPSYLAMFFDPFEVVNEAVPAALAVIRQSADPPVALANSPGARFFNQLAVVNGGALDTVEFRFTIGSRLGATLPQSLPKFRVIAVDTDGTVVPQRVPDATTDTDGFQYLPTPANLAAYIATTSYIYTCTAPGATDAGRYQYFAEVVDEFGAAAHAVGASNIYLGATITFKNVSIFDGRS